MRGLFRLLENGVLPHCVSAGSSFLLDKTSGVWRFFLQPARQRDARPSFVLLLPGASTSRPDERGWSFKKTPREKPRLLGRRARGFTAGFSVLELVIYIAILVTASAVTVNSLLRVQPVFRRVQLVRSMNTSGELIMQKITREIRLANSIDAASSVFDTHPGRLVLNTVMSETDSTPVAATLSLSSGKFQFQRSGQAVEILSSADVEVKNVVFRNVTQSSRSKAVKIEIALEVRKGTTTVSSNFYGTSILKNSY